MPCSTSGVTISGFDFRNCRGTAVVVQNDTSGSTLPVYIDSCRFSGNRGAKGGAVRVEAGAGAVITRSEFLDNSATNGSAVYISRTANVSIDDCSFTGNNARWGR
jgi:hypothetical protein